MDANLEDMPRCVRSLRYGLLLERADDVDVKGSRMTTAPLREEDDSWASLRTREQTGGFVGGGQCGRLGSREDHIPDGVVAGYAGICCLHYHHTRPGDPRRSQQCRDIQDRGTDCCGEEPLASSAGSTETHGPGDGGPGRLKAPR